MMNCFLARAMRCDFGRFGKIIALTLFGIVGCGDHNVKFPQFDMAIARIDRMIEAVNKGLKDVTKESEAWRVAFKELENQLHEDSADVLAHEVRNTGDAFISGIQETGQAWTDFIEVKLKDNLKAFRTALDKARQDVIAAKASKNVNGIKVAFDELANVVVIPDPVVTRFIPSQVDVRWEDYNQSSYSLRTNVVEARGWGFERPKHDTHRFEAFLTMRDVNGDSVKDKELRVPQSAIYPSTRYLLQIKLDDPAVKILPEHNSIVLKLGPSKSDWRLLPINHDRPENPAVVQSAAKDEEMIRLERAQVTSVEVTLKVLPEWVKHENYRVIARLGRSGDKTVVNANYENKAPLRIDDSVAMSLSEKDFNGLVRGDTIKVRVTSQHIPETGLQLQGHWEGELTIRLGFADGTYWSHSSKRLAFEHEGGLGYPNHKDRTSDYEFDIPIQ